MLSFSNPYLYLVLVALILGAFGAGVYYGNHLKQGEWDKSKLVSVDTKLDTLEKSNEVRSVEPTDAITRRRLLSGTF